MSIESVVLFTCDWCGAEAYTATGEEPEGWIQRGLQDYCDTCHGADVVDSR